MAQKPLLNRKETKTLLNTLKVTTAAGVLSLTLTGWGLLAQSDLRHTAQAEPVANTTLVAAVPLTLPTPTPIRSAAVTKLNIVKWARSTNGDPVAIVRDSRASLWYVMGSDVSRIEQGLQPQFQPQPVRVVTRTRSS